MRQLLIYGCAIIATLVPCSLAVAQFEEQNRIARYTWQGAARKAFRSPASNILGRPTVSPYLALADLTGMGQIDTSRNYFTQVRPQLENRRRAQQQQRSLRRVQQEVSAMRSASAQRSQAAARATGHPTRFDHLMYYYPGFPRRR